MNEGDNKNKEPPRASEEPVKTQSNSDDESSTSSDDSSDQTSTSTSTDDTSSTTDEENPSVKGDNDDNEPQNARSDGSLSDALVPTPVSREITSPDPIPTVVCPNCSMHVSQSDKCCVNCGTVILEANNVSDIPADVPISRALAPAPAGDSNADDVSRALAPAPASDSNADESEAEATVECCGCGATVNISVGVCNVCGALIEGDGAEGAAVAADTNGLIEGDDVLQPSLHTESSSSESEDEAPQIPCLSCGAPMKAPASSCYVCGALPDGSFVPGTAPSLASFKVLSAAVQLPPPPKPVVERPKSEIPPWLATLVAHSGDLGDDLLEAKCITPKIPPRRTSIAPDPHRSSTILNRENGEGNDSFDSGAANEQCPSCGAPTPVAIAVCIVCGAHTDGSSNSTMEPPLELKRPSLLSSVQNLEYMHAASAGSSALTQEVSMNGTPSIDNSPATGVNDKVEVLPVLQEFSHNVDSTVVQRSDELVSDLEHSSPACTMPCKSCGSAMRTDQELCMICGASIHANQEAITQRSTAHFRSCIVCHEHNAATSAYCARCGAVLPSAANPVIRSAAPRTSVAAPPRELPDKTLHQPPNLCSPIPNGHQIPDEIAHSVRNSPSAEQPNEQHHSVEPIVTKQCANCGASGLPGVCHVCGVDPSAMRQQRVSSPAPQASDQLGPLMPCPRCQTSGRENSFCPKCNIPIRVSLSRKVAGVMSLSSIPPESVPVTRAAPSIGPVGSSIRCPPADGADHQKTSRRSPHFINSVRCNVCLVDNPPGSVCIVCRSALPSQKSTPGVTFAGASDAVTQAQRSRAMELLLQDNASLRERLQQIQSSSNSATTASNALSRFPRSHKSINTLSPEALLEFSAAELSSRSTIENLFQRGFCDIVSEFAMEAVRAASQHPVALPMEDRESRAALISFERASSIPNIQTSALSTKSYGNTAVASFEACPSHQDFARHQSAAASVVSPPSSIALVAAAEVIKRESAPVTASLISHLTNALAERDVALRSAHAAAIKSETEAIRAALFSAAPQHSSSAENIVAHSSASVNGSTRGSRLAAVAATANRRAVLLENNTLAAFTTRIGKANVLLSSENEKLRSALSVTGDLLCSVEGVRLNLARTGGDPEANHQNETSSRDFVNQFVVPDLEPSAETSNAMQRRFLDDESENNSGCSTCTTVNQSSPTIEAPQQQYLSASLPYASHSYPARGVPEEEYYSMSAPTKRALRAFLRHSTARKAGTAPLSAAAVEQLMRDLPMALSVSCDLYLSLRGFALLLQEIGCASMSQLEINAVYHHLSKSNPDLEGLSWPAIEEWLVLG